MVETLVAVSVFVLVAAVLYGGYAQVMKVVRIARVKTIATALATEQFEIIRNMPYASVGLQGGVPAGSLLRTQILTRDGVSFYATTTIRNTDDGFDGTIGGSPSDLSPADYKTVALQLQCTTCTSESVVEFTTTVAPKGLETASTNGALFVKVFDANGQPLSGAQVAITNTTVVPSISINEDTNISGMVQIVDAPPAVEQYQIVVTKSGYSSERTYTPGDSANPNPTKSHATVALQQVTQSSFSIDRTSTFSIYSVDDTCAVVPSIPFTLSGSKLIGTSPNVLKFDQSFTTNGAGYKGLSDIEWDTYNLAVSLTSRYLAGTIPLFPLVVSPGSTQTIQLITVPKAPSAVLVTVADAASGLPVSGATVTLVGPSSGSKITGQGFMRQTDWSGGGGQATFTNPAQYLDSDGNINNGTTGQISLKTLFGSYVTDGILTSSTFDLGTSSNLYELSWQPVSQSVGVGASGVRFQIASNNDNATWDYRGPDGTVNTYYTSSGQSISSVHAESRYVRYRVFLHTDDVSVTPLVSDVSFTYSTACTPPGQVYFDSLSGGSYSLEVQKTGYQDNSKPVTIPSSGYTNQLILLQP